MLRKNLEHKTLQIQMLRGKYRERENDVASTCTKRGIWSDLCGLQVVFMGEGWKSSRIIQ